LVVADSILLTSPPWHATANLHSHAARLSLPSGSSIVAPTRGLPVLAGIKQGAEGAGLVLKSKQLVGDALWSALVTEVSVGILTPRSPSAFHERAEMSGRILSRRQSFAMLSSAGA